MPTVKSKTKNVTHKRNNKRSHLPSFGRYIFKVLKANNTDISISKKGIQVFETLSRDFFDQIALEASRLLRIKSTKTLSHRDIETAVKLLFPNELSIHAIIEAEKALMKYKSK